jgi:hypothetical protein
MFFLIIVYIFDYQPIKHLSNYIDVYILLIYYYLDPDLLAKTVLF